YVRSWAIQLMAEDFKVSAEAQKKLASMAADDGSALVRVYIASALQRMEPAQRWDILSNLSAHEEDFNDHNLPLMVWYALEPMIDADAERAVEIAKKAALPNLLTYAMQRVAATGDGGSSILRDTKKELEGRNDLREDQQAAIPVID